jgi:hypothetical protein
MAFGTLAIPTTVAARSRRPDLRVSSVSVSVDSVAAGGQITVHDRTVNRGPGSATASVTGYYLTRAGDHRRGTVRLGGRVVRALASGAASTGSREVTIPADTVPRDYRILACADDRGTVRERDKGNNCRLGSAVLTVTGSGGGLDTTPPTFAGVDAITVISQTAVRLSWTAGADNRTLASKLVYDVYVATASGAENYGSAAASSAPGASSVDITGLTPVTPYYFVVLARDQAGNRSVDKLERSVTIPDITPPTFAGIVFATEGGVCCYGPLLTWMAASDNITPATEIVYDIYASGAPGQEDLSTPTFTSAAGATSFQVPLDSTAGPYWTVRARDAAGNRDSNTHEVKTQLAP